MLMVIFGAGASYDSDPRLTPPGAVEHYVAGTRHIYRDEIAAKRPPLASELFDDRFNDIVARHPMCHGLFPRLRRAAREPGAPIEQTLEELTNDVAAHPQILRQLLALRGYICDVLTEKGNEWRQLNAGITNYVALLQDLQYWSDDRNEPVVLATFNYDTLLDDACHSVLGLELFASDPADLWGYISHPRFKLLKLHGSVDWLHRADNLGEQLRSLGYFWRRGFQAGSEVASSNPYALTWMGEFTTIYGGVGRPERADSDYFPAIAVPTVTKPNFECPQAHLDALMAAIPEVTRLLVIGWRGMEQHFLDLWRKPEGPRRLRRIQIVDAVAPGDNPEARAQAVEQNLFSAGLQGEDVRLFIGGFTGFLDGDFLEAFLSD